jgi:hypothetical protein
VRAQITALALALAATACNSQGPQPQDENLIDATVRVEPVASGNEAVNLPEGNVTPGELGNIHAVEPVAPEEIVRQFGDLLEQKRFADAYRLLNPQAMAVNEKQFESRFADYKTIESAVGTICPIEGAAGSLYSTVQLTLSGNKKNGDAYVMTGPVTLRRVNDVPGSTADQRRWHIVKMELTSNPKAAATKLDC